MAKNIKKGIGKQGIGKKIGGKYKVEVGDDGDGLKKRLIRRRKKKEKEKRERERQCKQERKEKIDLLVEQEVRNADKVKRLEHNNKRLTKRSNREKIYKKLEAEHPNLNLEGVLQDPENLSPTLAIDGKNKKSKDRIIRDGVRARKNRGPEGLRHRESALNFNVHRRNEFIKYLAYSGNLSYAAQCTGISNTTVAFHRKSDPEFNKNCIEAISIAADLLEKEAHRRAVEGVDKGVWFNGALVGFEKQYSDTLLNLLLKGNKPEKFKDRGFLSVANSACSFAELAEQVTREIGEYSGD